MVPQLDGKTATVMLAAVEKYIYLSKVTIGR